jgi:hypothetical protein
MNLIKWLRKNNKKIMAIVVVVLMIVFIGGTALEQLLGGFTQRQNKTIAYFGDGQKITEYDLLQAQRELEILQMIEAPSLLRAFPAAGPYMRVPAFYTVLLGELIFENKNISSQASSYIKQIAMTQGYSISEKQINDIYRRSLPARFYWLLLKEEAHQAGMRFSNDHAKYFLTELARSFFKTTYSQLMQSLVNPSAGGRGQSASEQEVLAAFSDLMSVWEYARLICSNEAVTEQQVRHNISLSRETMDIEFVRFDSLTFSKDSPEPSQEQIEEQFEKFKDISPGQVSDANSYGFGYKLPNRVAFQYLGVKLEDIEKIINKPTAEDCEQYYQQHRDLMKEKVSQDPNDPNSPMIERTLSFPEVADMIYERLLEERVDSKTNEILQKAKTLTELQINEDEKGSGSSTKMPEKIAEKYDSAAERLSKEYNTKIYSGKTGLLSAAAIQKDPILGSLYLEGIGYNPVINPRTFPLSKIAFSVDPIGESELGQFDIQKTKMYENIGPLKDLFRKTRMIIQIVDAQKESVPQDINVSFGIETTGLDENKKGQEKKNFSVKEKVIEDLKKLAAMETTRKKAEEFAKLATESGWDKAVDQFNRLYSKSPTDNNEPNAFGVRELFSVQRTSVLELQTLAVLAEGDPALKTAIPEMEKERYLKQKLYSLIPPDSNSLASVPYVLEFKPDMSCYCIKKLTVKRVNQDEYELFKAMQIFKEDLTRTQSTTAVHYNPENILSRMRFKLAEKQPIEDANSNKPAQPEAGT